MRAQLASTPRGGRADPTSSIATGADQPRKRRIRAGLVLACLLLGLVAGCRAEPTSRRVLLFGIDGATLRVIEPMMREGRLPHLASIARDGVHGVLESAVPPWSPRIWTTMATGKNPSGHGITHFIVDLPTGKRRLVASTDRRGHALWNIATERGLSVATVNWWVTHPPEKINGVMVSDHFLPSVTRGRRRLFDAEGESVGPVVYPAEWEPRVAELVERRASPSEAFADEPLPTWASRMKLEGWYRNDESVGQIALEIANALEPDVMLVIFKSVDPASHVLYATHFADDELPRPLPATDSQRASGRRVLQRFYEHADAWLGRLLTHYTQDDLVLVVSDHGFQVRKQFTGLTGEHHRGEALAGILFARGAGIEAGGRVENVHVRDMTPSVLHWLGLPVAEDMDGRPAAFIGGGEPTRIASYDRGPIERVGAKGSGAEAVMLEELEALGYFEPEEAAGSAPARAPEAHP